jgi:hypothetical protein
MDQHRINEIHRQAQDEHRDWVWAEDVIEELLAEVERLQRSTN